jgi:uncharacterized membrane protein
VSASYRLAAEPTDPPSRTDAFVRTVSQGLGGPIGRHAAAGDGWWGPARVAVLVGTLSYLAGVVFRLRCRTTVAGQVSNWYKHMCYSDIPLLYPDRGLLQGNIPYLDSGDYPVLEYPPLTGWFLDLERRLAGLLGAPQGLGLTAQQSVDSTLIFFDVNQVLLGGLFLVAILAQVHTVSGRPWDAMMLAASPCVAAAALINWDLLAVALTALGCLAWARRHPILAGVLLGLAMAAKLYPGLLLGPLFLLCLRSRRMVEFWTMFSTFLVSWLAANLPVIILAPQAWRSFWEYNASRGGDFGSIWYVFVLAGHPVPQLNLLTMTLFALACLGIALLIILAPRRPRFGAMAFLVVAAFLITNKVYSPQYVLWLLPLLILARPRWREVVIFSAAELIYFGSIWLHLGGFLTPGNNGQDRLYWLAVLLRLAVQCWLVIMVVRDALRPDQDPVRANGADDPSGGWLDGAPDAAWVRRLRPRPLPEPRRAA